MSDSTPRLGLAQLVSMLELNVENFNETMCGIDTLVDLRLLDLYVNDPPSSPADGDTYLVGGSPTGDWTGYDYKIASCLDGSWRFYTPFDGLHAYNSGDGKLYIYAGGVWSDFNPGLSAAETSVASAATCDVGAAGALFLQITGTTTITSFGTAANILRFVRFAGALTLTHNATSLILLGGASRTTAAGDVGIYASDSSGHWRERAYFRAASNAGDYATKSGTETLTNKTLCGPVVRAGATGAIVNEILTAAISSASNYAAFLYSTSNAYTGNLLGVQAETAAGTGWKLISGRRSGGNEVFAVFGNGNVQNSNNSYGAISDLKLKTDIVDAASQWSDVKALAASLKKYRLKTDPENRLQLGLIAQDVEKISPGLVGETPDSELVTDADGNKGERPTGTTTKFVLTSVLHMKALGALGEAMARIEALEAKLASLPGQDAPTAS